MTDESLLVVFLLIAGLTVVNMAVIVTYEVIYRIPGRPIINAFNICLFFCAWVLSACLLQTTSKMYGILRRLFNPFFGWPTPTQ
jgi:hypothetical protein